MEGEFSAQQASCQADSGSIAWLSRCSAAIRSCWTWEERVFILPILLTDSGEISQEATVIGIPCKMLGDSTERPETVEIWNNELIGADPELLRKSLAMVIDGKWKKRGSPRKWDGKSAERIVSAIESSLA